MRVLFIPDFFAAERMLPGWRSDSKKPYDIRTVMTFATSVRLGAAVRVNPQGFGIMARMLIPRGYEDLLWQLKERIRQAQLRATLAVNRELVLLYWQIGQEILTRQSRQGWGTRVIDRLAQDLRHEFPEMRGFSPRNLKYMRAFADAYPDEQFVQQVVAQLPWGHNVRLLDCVKDHFIWTCSFTT